MSAEMHSEFELLRASLRGDTGAFEAIVKKYQSFICAITFSATGNVDKSEELAQETFVSAWKDLAKLKDLNKFRSWLGSIARNIVRNSFRSQGRDLIGKAAGMDEVAGLGIRDSEPEEEAISKERQAVVRQALGQIPERYREPLVLYYRQGQSIRQVAEQLELSEETATIAARYLAAGEGLDLSDWVGVAAEQPTHARYVAACSIIRELEKSWNVTYGDIGASPWEEVSKHDDLLAEFSSIVRAWEQWARKNPKLSGQFFK